MQYVKMCYPVLERLIIAYYNKNKTGMLSVQILAEFTVK